MSSSEELQLESTFIAVNSNLESNFELNLNKVPIYFAISDLYVFANIKNKKKNKP